MKKRTRRGKHLFSWQQLTGALIGCGAALLGMAILSLLLYRNVGDEGVIGPVNAVLKVLCPCLAGFFAVGCDTERPYLSGLVAGVFYEALIVLLLCLFLGRGLVSPAVLGDLVISVAAGMAGAMIRTLAPHRK